MMFYKAIDFMFGDFSEKIAENATDFIFLLILLPILPFVCAYFYVKHTEKEIRKDGKK